MRSFSFCIQTIFWSAQMSQIARMSQLDSKWFMRTLQSHTDWLRFESMQQLKWLIIFLRQPKEDAAFCGNILQRERQTGQRRTGTRPPLFLLPECTKDCDEVKTDWAFQDLANKSDQSGTFETLFERRSEVWTCGSSSDLATASIFGSQTDRWERRQGKAKARPGCKSFSQLLPAYHSSQRPDTDGSVTTRTSSPLQST